jgi:hypothetical protein
MLLAGVVLKPVPVMVTVVPTTPEAGLKEVIVGGGKTGLFLMTETLTLK